MNRLIRRKREIAILLSCLLAGSIIAYIITTQQYEKELADKQEEHRTEIRSIVETYTTKLDNLQKATEEELELPEQITKYYPGDSYSNKTPNLSESDKQFLKAHVYGTWRFVERIWMPDTEDEKYNFTAQGVEEIKNRLVLEIRDDEIWLDNFSNNDFEDTDDFYLFVKGGFLPIVHDPAWECFETENAGESVGVYNMETEQYDFVSMDVLGELGYVSYTIGYDVENNPSYRGALPCRRIYPDLEDTDVLYVDFCGLWKLERY